jgi:hypothetical protein
MESMESSPMAIMVGHLKMKTIRLTARRMKVENKKPRNSARKMSCPEESLKILR